MLYQLRNLSERERTIVKHAPIWTTLLIACSDEDINGVEILRSKNIVRLSSFSIVNDVKNLYKEIEADFDNMINEEINLMPLEHKARIAYLTEKLEQLNPIFGKLEHTYAVQLYESLRKLATVVALADGGLFGIGSVSEGEAKFIHLPMLHRP